jgi:BNR repeat-like domain
MGWPKAGILIKWDNPKKGWLEVRNRYASRSRSFLLGLAVAAGLGSAAPAASPPRGYSIPVIDLSIETWRQVIVDREPGQYLGHPTTVLLEDGKTLIVVYPKGHGRGAILMKKSSNGGRTWSERLPTPPSWETSLETPTIHRVVDRAGKKRLILFSGLYPIRMSLSEDDGRNWTELRPIGNFGGIVVMSALVRLRNGDYAAYFHDDGRFLNGQGKSKNPPQFTVYRTLCQDGGLTWGPPAAVLTRPEAQLCEPCLVRSPDGNEWAMLLRENSRKFNSFISFSGDEGMTWSEPRELPGALTGDRHAARYAPDGRLFITFRDSNPASPTLGDWVGWVGSYEDMLKGREGQYRIRLMHNTQDADCAYPGLELLPEGTFVTTTYGHWTEGEPPYIVSIRFKLDELDALARAQGEGEKSAARPDWLIDPSSYTAKVVPDDAKREIALTNGLVERRFRLTPNAATVGFENRMTGESVLRGVKPEAAVEIDGQSYDVGGLIGQDEYAYLVPAWLENMTSEPEAFQFKGTSLGRPKPGLEWKRKRSAADLPWPPPGVSLTLDFVPPEGKLDGVVISVHYELYDGIPLLAKWLTLANGGSQPIRINSFKNEILAAVEAEATVEKPGQWSYPNIHVESDYAFLGSTAEGGNRTAHWIPDPQYKTQVNYALQTPCLLECRPPLGPDAVVEAGKTFDTFRTYELVFDSTDRERKGLTMRLMYRTIAPWVTENPIFMHLKSTDPQVVRTAIDQCAEVGFEMVILSFGSGLDMEDDSAANITRFKELADYAHAKGIELGGYSLLASRRINDDEDVLNPETGKTGGAVFGNSPCLGSHWGLDYFRKIRNFLEKTGFDLLEHDGSYPGDLCASTRHPGHRGLEDSQWTQWKTITDFYKWCRGRGIYLNVPDWYFLSGSNKTGMGYRESNWSLPRDRQIILGRQNIYDGTWEKTPSMGWMFVPLVEYQGGGEAATLEPLSEHLDAYEAHLAQNFGSGVQACYRGTRLYDTSATRDLVKKWVDFYKKHREILDSDVVHLRRPDGRDLDGILHVNPRGRPKGLAVLYNPTGRLVDKTIELPLYYAGLKDTALIRERDKPPVSCSLDRGYKARFPVKIPPHGLTWLVIE